MMGHSTLTDFLQFLILIPLGLGFVLLVPLFLLCVVSVHHLFIWCLREINNLRWAIKWSKSSPNSQSCTQFNPCFQCHFLDLIFNIVVPVDVVVAGAIHLLV